MTHTCITRWRAERFFRFAHTLKNTYICILTYVWLYVHMSAKARGKNNENAHEIMRLSRPMRLSLDFSKRINVAMLLFLLQIWSFRVSVEAESGFHISAKEMLLKGGKRELVINICSPTVKPVGKSNLLDNRSKQRAERFNAAKLKEPKFMCLHVWLVASILVYSRVGGCRCSGVENACETPT